MKRYAAAVGLPTDFDDFLRAPIGEGRNGVLLNVLSAFARLDIDPWQEAASLSELPRAMAVSQLAAIITALHDEPSILRDSDVHAARLIELLHGRANFTLEAKKIAPGGELRSVSITATAILLFLMFATSLFVSQIMDSTSKTVPTGNEQAMTTTKTASHSIPASASR